MHANFEEITDPSLSAIKILELNLQESIIKY